jgi:type VI secretion system protein
MPSIFTGEKIWSSRALGQSKCARLVRQAHHTAVGNIILTTMNQGLFESITGHFLDQTPIESVSIPNRRVISIMDHLNRLFNTREGSLPHLKDYGLPDISEIYRKMPHGIEELQKAIKKTIEKYEPRLQKIKVIPKDSDPKEFRLVFILTGELREGGLVRFQTTFTSMGSSSIAPWKKTE